METAIGDRLKGKVAIITGAASGMGRATALRFVQEGAQVVVADQNQSAAEETLRLIQDAGGEALFTPVDVVNAAQVQRMVQTTLDHFGRLEVLVNAAAISSKGCLMDETSEDEWDRILGVNLKGTFLCCKYAIPAILRSGGGAIVNVASMAAFIGPVGSVPYAVSKAGVVHFTTVAASHNTARGIRINCVSPGTIDTPMLRSDIDDAQSLERLVANHPLRRLATPEELANVVLFLASDEASWISGTTIIADGGKMVS